MSCVNREAQKIPSIFGFKILAENPSFGFILEQLFPQIKDGILCSMVGPIMRYDLSLEDYHKIDQYKKKYCTWGSIITIGNFSPFLDKMLPSCDLSLYFKNENAESFLLKDFHWDLTHHCYDDAWSELFTPSKEIADRIESAFKVETLDFPGSINTPGGIMADLSNP
jgi:hypothetical protein